MTKTVSLEEMRRWAVTPCKSGIRIILENVAKDTRFSAKECLCFKGATVYDLAFFEKHCPGFIDIDFRSASIDILETFSKMLPHPIIDGLNNIKVFNTEELVQKQKEARVLYKLFQNHKLSQIIACVIWCCEKNITCNEFFNVVTVHWGFFKEDQDKIDGLKHIVLGYL